MSLDLYDVESSGPYRSFGRRREDGLEVVIKELAMGRVADWKELELFEREVKVLRQLDHPRIPAVVDSFDGDGDSPSFYLVCSRLPGARLREKIGSHSEAELIRIARDVLEILRYLQGFSPPVLHRNITVDSIVIDDHGRASLSDFGSVQVELKGTVGGSTVVGTSGYMAPEQLLGRATTASDVYALGASLVHALTGVEPADLPVERMKLHWRTAAPEVSERFAGWLERAVAPSPQHRFENADSALRSLVGGQPSADVGGILAARPVDTTVAVSRTERKMEVVLPKPSGGAVSSAVLLAGLALVIFGFISSMVQWMVAVPLGLGFAVVGSVGVRRWWQDRGGSTLTLDLDRGYRLRRNGKLTAGALRDVLAVTTGYRGQTDRIWLATEDEMLATSGGLSEAEVEWLRDEVGEFLQLTEHPWW